MSLGARSVGRARLPGRGHASGETKEHDTRRQDVADTFLTWWDKHRGRPVTARDLDFAITRALDPQSGRQYLAARLQNLVRDTRGWLRAHAAAARGDVGCSHLRADARRRGRRPSAIGGIAVMAPMTPMPPMLVQRPTIGRVE